MSKGFEFNLIVNPLHSLAVYLCKLRNISLLIQHNLGYDFTSLISLNDAVLAQGNIL